MTAVALVKLAVLGSIALGVISFGLGSTLQEATSLLRDPRRLARSLLVMNVLMPLFAVLLALVFDFEPAVRIALITLSLSPILPLLPRKEMKAGAHAAYALGLYSAVAVLAIVFVPLVVSVLAQALGLAGTMGPRPVARLVIMTVALPLAIGIAIGNRAPRLAARIADPISVVSNVLLLLAVIPILAVSWRLVIAILGNGTVLAFVAFVAGGLVLGELFGGPEPAVRTALAMSNASRHPGIALAIAGVTFADQKLVAAAVLLYLVINTLVSIPYLRWARRHQRPIGTRPAMAGH